MRPKQLKLMEIESPLQFLDKKDSRELKLFYECLILRIHGYSRFHQKPIMPVSVDDFYDTHLIVQWRDKILGTWKLVEFSQQEKNDPVLKEFQKAGDNQDLKWSQYFSEHWVSHYRWGYIGGMACAEGVSHLEKSLFFDLFGAYLAFLNLRLGFHSIFAFANTKAGLDIKMQKFGIIPFGFESIEFKQLNSVLAKPLRLLEPTKLAEDKYSKFEDIFEDMNNKVKNVNPVAA